jgi:hypothetical protein
MKRFIRAVSFFSLLAFSGLTVAESFHSHHAIEVPSQCALCTIAHQTPALTSTHVVAIPVLCFFRISDQPIYRLLHAAPLEHHSLSPPLAPLA